MFLFLVVRISILHNKILKFHSSWFRHLFRPPPSPLHPQIVNERQGRMHEEEWNDLDLMAGKRSDVDFSQPG